MGHDLELRSPKGHDTGVRVSLHKLCLPGCREDYDAYMRQMSRKTTWGDELTLVWATAQVTIPGLSLGVIYPMSHGS